MSSIIDEEINENIEEDPEISHLKAKLAQIPQNYPQAKENEKNALNLSKTSNSFEKPPQNLDFPQENCEFRVNEPEFFEDLREFSHDNRAFLIETAQKPEENPQKSRNLSNSDLSSREILDKSAENLSSNASNQRFTSNLSFKVEKLTLKDGNLSSNISSFSNFNAKNEKNASFSVKNASFSLKNASFDSNLSSFHQLNAKDLDISSNLSANRKETDSNISFFSENAANFEDLRELTSNLSLGSGKLSGNHRKTSENPRKSKEIAENIAEPVKNPTNLRKKPTGKLEKLEKRDKITKPPLKAPEIPSKPVKNSTKPQGKPGKSHKLLRKAIKEAREDEERDPEGENPGFSKGKAWKITRESSKENHKQLLNEILKDFSRKEQKSKETEAKLFALEILEKKKLLPANPQETQENSKKNWDFDTKIATFSLETHKKQVKESVQATQSQAERFLAKLQGRLQGKTAVKPTKVDNFVAEDELFEEKAEEHGDQSAAPMKIAPKTREDELFSEENAKFSGGDQQIPDKSAGSRENLEEKPKKSMENTWKYSVGVGQATEYAKTQKLEEIAEKQQKTAKNKAQSQGNVAKKQQLLEIEKEIRKKQKEIVTEQRQIPSKLAEKVAKPAEPREKPVNIQSQAALLEKQEAESQAIRELRSDFRAISQENRALKASLAQILREKQAFAEKIESLKGNSKVLCLSNGKFTSFGFVPTVSTTNASEKSSENASFSSENLKNNDKALEFSPLARIVNKIAIAGLQLAEVFELLDVDGDKILSLSEIKANLPRLSLNLSAEEIEELLRTLDSNTDGVVNKEEFLNCLEKPLEVEQEYVQIMGNLREIDNPLVLEERKLEISLRKKLVEQAIAKEMRANAENQRESTKTVAKLRKYEALFAKATKNSKSLRNDSLALSQQLQEKVQELQRVLERNSASFRDKMQEIEENIAGLRKELLRKAEKVQESKQLLQSQSSLYHKLQLKQLNFGQIAEKLKRNLQLINENELRLNQHIQTGLELKTSRDQHMLKKLHFAVNLAFCATKIQAFFRMKREKRRFFAVKLRLLQSKARILAVYREFQRKRRGKRCFRGVFAVFLKRKAEIFAKIKEFSLFMRVAAAKDAKDEVFFKENELEQGDELLPSFPQKTELFREISKENEKNEDFDANINEERLLEQEYLASALTIQRKLRAKWTALKKETAKIELSKQKKLNFADLEHFCTYCKRLSRGEREVQRICRECKDAFFCLSCFENYHRSKQTRNHAFYELQDNGTVMLENEANLQFSIDKIATKLKGGKYEALENEFLAGDKGFIGLIKQEIAESLLLDVVGDAKDEQMKFAVKFVCKYAVEKADKAFLMFKSDKNRFDRKISYVNYEKLLTMLVSARETMDLEALKEESQSGNIE